MAYFIPVLFLKGMVIAPMTVWSPVPLDSCLVRRYEARVTGNETLVMLCKDKDGNPIELKVEGAYKL